MISCRKIFFKSSSSRRLLGQSNEKHFSLIVCLLIFFCSPKVFGGETDQYLTLKNTLSDSLTQLNYFMNMKLLKTLKENSSASCTGLAQKYLYNLGHGLNGEIELWVKANASIEIFPKRNTHFLSYLSQSIFKPDFYELWDYRHALDPSLMAGGVYFGTDKLSHYVGSGLIYYKKYLALLKTSSLMTEDLANVQKIKALKNAIDTGVGYEFGIVGLASTGVFSYPDLEANFQGMQLARSLCEKVDSVPNSPLLEKKGTVWLPKASIDFMNHLNPLWDETFNVPGFSAHKWENISRNIKTYGYCSKEYRQSLAQRFELYEQILSQKPRSLSWHYLQELQKAQKTPQQQNFTLDAACK